VNKRYSPFLANCKPASSMVSDFKLSIFLCSEKEPRVKKFESPSSRSKRVEPIAHLSTNRSVTFIISRYYNVLTYFISWT
jgi:hypothetical protein